MKYIVINNHESFLRTLMVCVFVLGLYSCNSDDVDGDSYFTFTGETVASYCEKNAEYSIFSNLMKESGSRTLLASYGHYTCFAPSDSAFGVYFSENQITYADLTTEDKQNIVYNHIIKTESEEYLSAAFKEGALSSPNMNNRYLVISFGEENQRRVIYVNKESPILQYDNEVHNGVIHKVGRVIVPSEEFLNIVLEKHSHFKLFSEAFELTHLGDSVMKIYDDSYKSPIGTDLDSENRRYPQYLKYGYTLFAESDDVFTKAGITNIDQLVTYASRFYGTEDLADYTSRNNPLNKFISYHLLGRQISTSSFLYNGACTSPNAEDKKYEYYETMLKDRLIEIKTGNKLNTRSNGSYVALDDARSNLDGVNGFVHTLADILVYDENIMENDVLNKRIRFDAYALPPQLTNNNIRFQLVGAQQYTITNDYCGEYIQFNEASQVTMWASESWTNYQADEIKIKGWFDFTIRMHPVPPGTYEIRLGYRAEPWRGVGQLFIDGEIAGIPVDLRTVGTDPDVGWIKDSDTTDNGVENDKMMRNRGYMKAPNSVFTLNGNITLRDDYRSLRIIIGTYTFQEYGPHYLRIKNVEDGDREFHLDYMEYVPVSYLDYEGID